MPYSLKNTSLGLNNTHWLWRWAQLLIMPFLCPCKITSLLWAGLPSLQNSINRNDLAIVNRPESVLDTVPPRLSCCHQHHLGGQVQQYLRSLLEVPGHIRDKAGFEPKLFYTGVCFEFISSWKMGSHSPVSTPTDHLIIIRGPQSLNFPNKCDRGENSLKPQNVLYPLICSANSLPITVNTDYTCTSGEMGQ